MRTQRAFRAGSLALLVYLGLSSAFLHTLVHPASTASQGGDGDPGLLIWFLANTSRSLWHAHGHGLLITHRLNAPYGVNVPWNAGLLLPGIVLSPITELFGPVVTFNVLIAVAPGLTAWTAYLCSGRFLEHRAARFVTGLAAGFSPAVVAGAQGHLQLTLLLLAPVLLLLSVDLATGHRAAWRTGLLLGLAVGAQLLISEEVVVLSAFAVAALLLLLAVQRPREVPAALRRLVVGGLTGVVPLLLVAGYPLFEQFTGPQRVHGELQVSDRYKLDPAQLVVPQAKLLLHTSRSTSLAMQDHIGNAEMLGYVGVPMIVLVLLAAVLGRRSLLVRTSLAAALALAVLALGETLRLYGRARDVELPWHLSEHVGLLVNVLPVRWMLLVDLLLALVLGVAVQALLTRRHRVLAALLAVVVLVPFLPEASQSQPLPVPQYFADGAAGLTGNVLLVPLPDPPHALPMTWQAVAGLRFNIVSGYFVGPDLQGRAVFGPRQQLAFRAPLNSVRKTGGYAPLTPRDVTTILAGLRAIDVHTIVLGPSPNTAIYTALITQVTGQQPERTGGVLVWHTA